MEKEVQDWIENVCPPEWKSLLLELRTFLFKKYPELEEKIKWNVPFYSLGSGLCYLNPKKKLFEVGFMKGFRMSDPDKKLNSTDLKMIRHCIFTHEQQPWEDLEFYLDQGVYLNHWDKTV